VRRDGEVDTVVVACADQPPRDGRERVMYRNGPGVSYLLFVSCAFSCGPTHTHAPRELRDSAGGRVDVGVEVDLDLEVDVGVIGWLHSESRHSRHIRD
jgi:hypothetical protein